MENELHYQLPDNIDPATAPLIAQLYENANPIARTRIAMAPEPRIRAAEALLEMTPNADTSALALYTAVMLVEVLAPELIYATIAALTLHGYIDPLEATTAPDNPNDAPTSEEQS